MLVKAGKTDVSVEVFLADSTTGAPLTGKAYNSAGIDLKYRREFEAAVSITEATLAALTTAHADGGFLEIGNGWYRLDLPDDAVDTAGSSTRVVVFGTITGGVVYGPTIQLVAFDPADTVRLGLTAMPNVASGSAGAIVTAGTGTAQLSTSSGQVILQTGTGTGQLDFTSGVVKSNLINIAGSAVSTSSAQIGVNVVNAGGTAWGSGAITSGAFAAGAINAAAIAADAIGASELAADAVAEIQSGLATASALSTVAGYLDTEIAAILADTNELQTDWADGGRLDLIIDSLATSTAVQDANDNLSLVIAVTNKLDDTLEDDAGTYRFTTNALEQAPTDGAAPTAAAIADAVWDESTSGHTTSGTFGEQLKTDVDAILVDTAEIGAAGAGLTAADDAVIAAIAALNNLSAAQVNAEVVDALNVDTYAEPGQGTPAATTTLVYKIGLLYKALRNRKTQTATEFALYADDGTTKDQEAVVSDDLTTTEVGELSTGA